MNKLNKNKELSPLAQAVLKLDNHFSELERLSANISETELKSEFEVNQMRKLMSLFGEHGEAVGVEIVELANQLNEARTRAEAAARVVAEKAEELKNHQEKQNRNMEAFHNLAAKVQGLNEQLMGLKKPEGEALTEEERVQLAARLSELDLKLQPLIEEAMNLKHTAHDSKMKNLEQNADSLTQSLRAVSQKIELITKSASLPH